MRENLATSDSAIAQGGANVDVVLVAHGLGDILAVAAGNLTALLSLLLSKSNRSGTRAHRSGCTQERTTSHRKRFHYRTPLLLAPCRFGTSRRKPVPLAPEPFTADVPSSIHLKMSAAQGY